MKILIVDDEKLARKRIRTILSNRKEITLYEASSGTEAVSKITDVLPDIVFLDIKMTDFSGFDVLRKLNPSRIPTIIFVTAYDDFALEAFEIQAVDYLLKPYKEKRVLDALEKAIKKVEAQQKSDQYDKMYAQFHQLFDHLQDLKRNAKPFLEKLVLKVGRKYVFAYTKDLCYIVSSAYYAELFMADGKKHLYRTSMTALMERLDPESFIRLNRSTIVRIQEIEEVISEGYGDYCVIMTDGRKFNVSKSYKSAFKKQLTLGK